MLRRYLHFVPQVASSAYVDESAQVIGNVVIGERSTVGPNVTIRGDVNAIRIGDDTCIEDSSVLHCEPELFPLTIGNRVTIEHRSAVHGCVIEDDCVIGIGAIVLNGAVIGKASSVGAGALIREGDHLPPGSLIEGLPGKVIRQLRPEEMASLDARRTKQAEMLRQGRNHS